MNILPIEKIKISSRSDQPPESELRSREDQNQKIDLKSLGQRSSSCNISESLCALLEAFALQRVGLLAAVGGDPQQGEGDAAQKFRVPQDVLVVHSDVEDVRHVRDVEDEGLVPVGLQRLVLGRRQVRERVLGGNSIGLFQPEK